jgi:hypothetical protein
MQRTIVFEWPILPGSVSTARSRCGKAKCACKACPPRLHGTYYRWTGFVAGRRTTKTLRRETAMECRRRIRNFRNLQRQIERLVREAFVDAPWAPHTERSRTRGKR